VEILPVLNNTDARQGGELPARQRDIEAENYLRGSEILRLLEA